MVRATERPIRFARPMPDTRVRLSSNMRYVLAGSVLFFGLHAFSQADSLRAFRFLTSLRTTAPHYSGPVTLLSLSDSGAFFIEGDMLTRRAVPPPGPGTFAPASEMIRIDMERRGGKARGAIVGIAFGYVGGYLLARSYMDRVTPLTTFQVGTVIALPFAFIGKGFGRGYYRATIQGSDQRFRSELRKLQRALPK